MPGLTQNFLQKPLKTARGVSDAYYGQATDQTKKSFAEAKGYQQPWNEYGADALSDFRSWREDPGAVTRDPSYQWRFGEGQNAVENSAAARGGALSGNALRAITDYGQNAASQEYQNEWNRFMQELGIGQNAAGNMSNLATGEGNALSNLLTGRGTNWFNSTLGIAQEVRAAENDLNNLIQSWFPSSGGGGGK